MLVADASLMLTATPTARREAVRNARRELKAVRAIAPLCRSATTDVAIDGVLEFSAKANQLLGPLRDRDALSRSIHRLADRFADAETRRVTRTILLATLILAEADRRDDAAYSDASIDRAKRSIRSARAVVSSIGPDATIDSDHAALLMQRSFADCRDELSAALNKSDLARLHECRKKASFLALAMRTFEDELPSSVRRMRARAKRLAAALGEDRDLALLDVEMRATRSQLSGSPLAAAIDDALRLARLEAGARVEDAARAFLRLGRGRVRRGLDELFGRCD